MVAYKVPQQWKKGENEKLRGEIYSRQSVKFLVLIRQTIDMDKK